MQAFAPVYHNNFAVPQVSFNTIHIQWTELEPGVFEKAVMCFRHKVCAFTPNCKNPRCTFVHSHDEMNTWAIRAREIVNNNREVPPWVESKVSTKANEKVPLAEEKEAKVEEIPDVAPPAEKVEEKKAEEIPDVAPAVVTFNLSPEQIPLPPSPPPSPTLSSAPTEALEDDPLEQLADQDIEVELPGQDFEIEEQECAEENAEEVPYDADEEKLEHPGFTVYCPFTYFDKESGSFVNNCHNENNCAFEHMQHCRFGQKCNKASCSLVHVSTPARRLKHKMCPNLAKGCKFGAKCNFAHSVENLDHRWCSFNILCRNIETCTYAHTGDIYDAESDTYMR